MRCSKVLCNYFVKKSNLNLTSRLRKPSEFCNFIEKKVKFYTSESKMIGTFDPPERVNGMKVLDRGAFKKTITVPSLTVANQNLNASLKLLKSYSLKIYLLKPVVEISSDKKIILLNPEKVRSWNDFEKDVQEHLKKLNIEENNFSETNLELGYENWKANELLTAVLPKDELVLSSYSQIGHIIHLNLKDHLLEYKQIIGEILLDKLKFARTVVYKKEKIDNTFRTTKMEVICGEPNFMVSVRENNCIFEFDFSKVYWNPRLSTEHARIVNKINFGDALFDVFAGVGPFAILAAKKKCMVHANDLNPESFQWLNHNISLNKKCKDYIKTYNKDGGDFILNDLKEQLLKIWQDEFFIGKIYVVMNLPVMAATFMKYFKGLITEDDLKGKDIKEVHLPCFHCYFFSKEENDKDLFEQKSGMNLDGIDHEFHFVRAVSNYVQMYRITFTLPRDYLLETNVTDENSEPLSKKRCTNSIK